MFDLRKTEFLRCCGLTDQLPHSDKNEIVFCGRSNSGKSSLINKLCNRKSLARVSSTPGKTATINFYSAGDGFALVDLPGYGYAKRSLDEKKRWSSLIEHYFSSGRNIKLALVLLDSRREPSEEDEAMFELLRRSSIDFLIVATKTDKLNKTEFSERTEYFERTAGKVGARGFIPFTVNGGDSADRLRAAISELSREW